MLRTGRGAIRLVEAAASAAQMRDKDGFLVGWGMGTATFPALMFAAEARAVITPRRLRRDGDRRA